MNIAQQAHAEAAKSGEPFRLMITTVNNDCFQGYVALHGHTGVMVKQDDAPDVYIAANHIVTVRILEG